MKADRNVSIRSIDGMKGVFADRPFQAGEIVCDLSEGEIITSPTRTSIQIKTGVHVEDPIGAFVNHSCYPVCKIDGWHLVAVEEISDGNEITFDYSQNEDMMDSPFVCRCCGRFIFGKHK